MKIIVHCGLHRTGSTALQRALLRAAPALEARGVRVEPLLEVRGTVCAALDLGDWGRIARPMARSRIRDWAAAREREGVTRLVISDEVISGLLEDSFTEAGPFPNAPARYTLLAEALSAWPCKATVALRETGDWANSAYAFALTRRPQAPKEEVRAAVLGWRRGFAGLVGELHEAFGGASAWLSEFYRERPRRVHRLLLGDAAAETRRPGKRTNAAPSSTAMEEVTRLRAEGRRLDREALVALRAAHPAEAHGRFEMFSEDERAALAERFEAELAEIRKRGCEVLALRPGGGGPDHIHRPDPARAARQGGLR